MTATTAITMKEPTKNSKRKKPTASKGNDRRTKQSKQQTVNSSQASAATSMRNCHNKNTKIANRGRNSKLENNTDAKKKTEIWLML